MRVIVELYVRVVHHTFLLHAYFIVRKSFRSFFDVRYAEKNSFECLRNLE